MSSNVSLPTPRGTGTSGYIQRNLSILRPRDSGFGAPYAPISSAAPRQRQPDQKILQHDRQREIELKVLELQDSLEDKGELDEDQIEEECKNLRKKLTTELERGSTGQGSKKMKIHQVHELAEAKIRESEKLRKALGLKEVSTGEEGVHPMARQEERRRREEERREAEEGQDRAERAERRNER